MNHLVSILFASILTTHSLTLKSMDFVEKGITSLSRSLRPNHSDENIPLKDRKLDLESAGKKKRGKSYSTNSQNQIHVERLAPILETPILKANMLSDTHPLITAACTQNYDIIKFYLADKYLNPNVQEIESLDTPLHYAAEHKNKKLIDLFLHDPRTNASLRNRKMQTAREKIVAGPDDVKLRTQDIELRIQLFARITLDIIVEKQAKELKNIYFSGHMTLEIFDTIVQMIKQKFLNFQTKQTGDQVIPESALLPDYATDDFIKDMIRFSISNAK